MPFICHRARNRVTAAESRRKSKVEAHALREDVNRINRDLKAKTDLLGEYKDKFAMYESGRSKAEVDRVISQRRSEAAAAAAAAEIVPLSMIASVPVIEVPLGGETARL